jgi:malonyl-CoA O-methyltransferase
VEARYPRGEESPFSLDIASVRRSFERASAGYDAVAVLQSEVRTQLLQRLELTALAPGLVVDLGAGTGQGSRALKDRYPRAQVLAIDSAPGMLRVADGRQSWRRRFGRICADAERLPLADGSVDLLFSNLLLPWCEPERLFMECRRVLAPQGLLTLSAFGPDTLGELRMAWAAVDTHSHVNRFIDMHDLGDALVRAGFAAPVLDVDRYTLQYTDVHALARDLKALGTRNFTRDRPRGLTSPRRFAAMQAAYEGARQDGRLPATYEVVFAQAWAPARAAPGRGSLPDSGETKVALADLQQQLRDRRKP